ncbi:hypothetical protein MES4922_100068 [Mesorhizobium ventifaucium]|uniref:Uncharacterized protein n=1 Tax=Mesorhizobium ventifaucium TaxID=666020 RepID=A0ABM9DD64_9HYPH|nr:hypothetical protein MES4922_100068 [Mesorhizobium ventifaucium]
MNKPETGSGYVQERLYKTVSKVAPASHIVVVSRTGAERTFGSVSIGSRGNRGRCPSE